MTCPSSSPLWLAGMPEYHLVHANRHVPGLLLGCAQTARGVLAESGDQAAFAERFDAEYGAVLRALLEAGMPFRILNLHRADSPLANRLRAEGYPDFRLDVPAQGSTYTYPRDLMVYLPDHALALVSEGWLKPGAGNRAGVDCWPSIWSEGGRVLVSGDTLVVFRHPDKKHAPEQSTLNKLRERGLAIVEIPAGIFCSLDQDGDITGLFHDHHIDRAAGLVRGLDGACHLLLGPGYRTGPLDAPWDEARSLDAVQQVAAKAGITVHPVADSDLPYATSLVQSPDGAVAVSGGEEFVAGLLGDLVGPENVVVTETPLTHFPVFASAGLHCLVTESPEFLLAARDE